VLIARWQRLYGVHGCVAGQRVALCLKNSVHWVAADLAALARGLVVVPLYVDDNAENAAWCALDAQVTLLIAETRRIAEALVAAGLPRERVLALRENDGATPAAFLPQATAGLAICQDDANALATICYTSGTSGRPKGVMLSHGNILANVAACAATDLGRSDDIFLSILPLSHMFERTGGYYLPLALGAKVAYARGIAQIAEDLVTQAPTVMFAVPRIFEKFAARIEQTLAESKLKRFLFDQCIARGYRVAQKRATLLDMLLIGTLRKLVAQPILARLGGRLRLTVVGGAALDPQLARTFLGLGLPMLQGYGMTEASPVVSVNRPDDNVPESVGAPLPGVEVRVADSGELLVRAASVMQGYWNHPEATAAAIDAEKWLHTGDIAEIRDGKIFIRGRSKDIVVLSNGEKLSPQDVEIAILHDPVFEQILLIGEGKPFLSLLAVTQNTDEKALIQRANEQLKNFPRYIRIRRVIPTREPWTIENGLLTPTLKLKRAPLFARFAKQIEAVYAVDAIA
jgi:long-chain acyl-CoA synthetase